MHNKFPTMNMLRLFFKHLCVIALAINIITIEVAKGDENSTGNNNSSDSKDSGNNQNPDETSSNKVPAKGGPEGDTNGEDKKIEVTKITDEDYKEPTARETGADLAEEVKPKTRERNVPPHPADQIEEQLAEKGVPPEQREQMVQQLLAQMGLELPTTESKIYQNMAFLRQNMNLDLMEIVGTLLSLNTNGIVNDSYNAVILHEARYEEVIEELIKRLRFEVEEKELGPMTNSRLVYMQSVLLTLNQLLEGANDKFFDGIMDSYELTFRDAKDVTDPHTRYLLGEVDAVILGLLKNHNIKSDETLRELMITFIGTKRAIEYRETTFPSLLKILKDDPNVPEQYKRIHSSTPDRAEVNSAELAGFFDEGDFLNRSTFKEDKARVTRIRSYLEAHVIDQPEVIDYLINVERKKALHQTKRPNVFATIGLPGTGKDTLAEAYVQAMHPHDKQAVDKYLYRMKIVKDKSEIWSELGSATGFVGSDQEPKLIKWLTEVSGGKYIMQQVQTMSGPAHQVIINPEWEGRPLPGFVSPDKAVLFINEFHNWSSDAKDDPLKQFLEKGIIEINNPNGGEKQIQVPVTVQIASNNGIELLADRHEDGRPRGSKSQTYEEILKRWEAARGNMRVLVSQIMKGAGGAESNVQGMGSNKKGTSEEVANRIQNIFLLRPISPEGIQKIIDIKLKETREQYLELKDSIGKLEITWSKELPARLQEYQYNAEEGGRPVEKKIETFLQHTLDKMVFEEILKPNGETLQIKLDVAEAADGTYELIAKTLGSKELVVYAETIKASEVTRYANPLSDREIDRLLRLDSEINAQVSGLEFIMEKITDAIIASELDRNVNLDRVGERIPGAQAFGFFGLSSTGKTELAKVIAEVLTGNRDNIWEVEANHLQSEDKWEKFFGVNQTSPDQRSEFQKEYDKRNGKMVVVLDELTNVKDKSLLQKLYPYFRESEVAGRKVANVIFIVTGNTGQEVFRGIPSEVPEQERFWAEQEIYKKFLREERTQEQMLYRDYPEPLVKRMGLERAFFFPPLNHKSIKKLFQIKLKQSLNYDLAEHKEKHWWDVKFSDKQNFDKMLAKMADEGFRQDGQGDSINRYATKTFASRLKVFLVKNKIDIGEEIIVSLDEKKTQEAVDVASKDEHNDEKQDKKGVYLNLEIPGKNQNLTFFLPGKPYDRPLKDTKVNRALTGYHEAGHEIVGKALMGDLMTSTKVSIIPGVDRIGSEFVYYAGIRVSAPIKNGEVTREYILYQIAGLLGGTVAEELVSKGDRSTAGKHNDIQRASHLARRAILEFGLSKRLGNLAKGAEESLHDFEEKIKHGPKGDIYQQELDWYLTEGMRLAKESILMNWKTFIDIGQEVLDKGELDKNQIEEIYKRSDFISHQDARFNDMQSIIQSGEYTLDAIDGLEKVELTLTEKLTKLAKSYFTSKKKGPTQQEIDTQAELDTRSVHLIDERLMPEKIVDTQEIIAKRVELERAEVEIMSDLPFKNEVSDKMSSEKNLDPAYSKFKKNLCASVFM